MVTPKRQQHSFDSMRIMSELAEIYSLDCETAMTIGLLHDVARDIEINKLMILVNEAELKFNHQCEKHIFYLHGPTSAYLVQKELNITEPNTLEAISGHTFYGNIEHRDKPLTWCIRFADVLAPTKEWSGMKKLKRIVYMKQIEQASLLLCKWLIEYIQGKSIPLHPRIVKTYEELSVKLNVNSSFFERRH